MFLASALLASCAPDAGKAHGDDTAPPDTSSDPCATASLFADDDGDGYGAGAGVATCSGTVGWVETSGDCDDTDAAVNPLAAEICDGVDDDCDGVADPVGSVGCTDL